MKKIILSAAILLSCLTAKIASAQVSVGLGVNIGSQPDWGPVGYDQANYYYMPDIDTYYDVPTHQYVYYDNNVWVHRRYLPARYAHYNLYGGYKVVINDRNPWLRHDYYRTHYIGYRGRHDQVIIRNSRDVRYANHWRGDRGRYGSPYRHNYYGRGPVRGGYNHGGYGRGPVRGGYNHGRGPVRGGGFNHGGYANHGRGPVRGGGFNHGGGGRPQHGGGGPQHGGGGHQDHGHHDHH